jgi:SNF2 family DNA or RNA helicase
MSILNNYYFMGYKKYIFKTQPYEHQQKALQQSFDKPYYGLFMEMGTGKTKVLLDTVGILHHNHKIEGALIIAPKSVFTVWVKNEIPTHYPFVDECDIVSWSNASTIKNRLAQERLFARNGNFKIFVMNVEALSRGNGFDMAKQFLNKFKCLMAIDESSKIKNPSADRTKNILKLKDLAPYRRILTGTPVTNSPLDVYTQLEFLDKTILGHSSFYSFRNRYCVFHESIINGKIVKFPKYFTNLKELEEKVKTHSYRVTKDECLDLPEKVYQQRFCELGKKQKKIYDDLKSHALAILEDDSISFQSKLTEILRLHQVANGFVMTDNGDIQEFEDSEKIKLLLETLDELPGKVIIWACYTHNIKQIAAALRSAYGTDSTVTFFGGDSNESRTEARESFQKNPKTRFFVGNTASGGMGLTLTSSHTMIYFNNNYSYEQREQSEARIHRISQKFKCTYIDLICRDTIDEKVISILKDKIKLSAKILGEKAREWL